MSGSGRGGGVMGGRRVVLHKDNSDDTTWLTYNRTRPNYYPYCSSVRQFKLVEIRPGVSQVRIYFHSAEKPFSRLVHFPFSPKQPGSENKCTLNEHKDHAVRIVCSFSGTTSDTVRGWVLTWTRPGERVGRARSASTRLRSSFCAEVEAP